MAKNNKQTLKIGTRGSPLAILQAEEVQQGLIAAHEGIQVKIVVITTTGDRIQDRNLAAIGGKGLFTKEIEQALIENRIDLAVHSAKDLPAELPSGLILGPILSREDTREALISRNGMSLHELPHGAIFGTASLRRQAQILFQRSDLSVVPFRGNVETRLRKLSEGEVEATLLAVAGLNRLQRRNVASEILDSEKILPAIGQGALAVEMRADDLLIADLCGVLNDETTAAEVTAERAVLRVLDGSCRTPIAGLAETDVASGRLHLSALIAKPDGSTVHKAQRTGLISDAKLMGWDLGYQLKRNAGPGFLP